MTGKSLPKMHLFSSHSRPFSAPARERGANRGLSMVELIIAISLSLVAMLALISTVLLTNQFLKESFWENRLRAKTSVFMEKCKLALTFAYRRDTPMFDPSRDTTYKPIINDAKDEILFWTPDDQGDPTGVEAYELRRISGTNKVELKKNGVELDLLRNVTDFHIENQAGLLTFVVTVNYRFSGMGGRGVRKQFTLVTRALPRNHGNMVMK